MGRHRFTELFQRPTVTFFTVLVMGLGASLSLDGKLALGGTPQFLEK
jgi:hypothetical protein